MLAYRWIDQRWTTFVCLTGMAFGEKNVVDKKKAALLLAFVVFSLSACLVRAVPILQLLASEVRQALSAPPMQ